MSYILTFQWGFDDEGIFYIMNECIKNTIVNSDDILKECIKSFIKLICDTCVKNE